MLPALDALSLEDTGPPVPFSPTQVERYDPYGGRPERGRAAGPSEEPAEPAEPPVQLSADPSPEELGLKVQDVPDVVALNEELLKAAMRGTPSECLEKYGVCLVRTQFGASAEALTEAQDRFWKMMHQSPEFRPRATSDHFKNDPTWVPSEGGFGALGNPSSFHHPFACAMREIALYEVLKHNVLPLRGRKLEKPFDRMMVRQVGKTPTEELVHRDIAEGSLDGDDVFGGWINLNSRNQRFLCCPKTNHEVMGQNHGFVKLTSPKLLRFYKAQLKEVTIPPGFMMTFYERLVHEVAPSNKTTDVTIRAHVGFRLTHHDEPLFGSAQTRAWIENQGVPKIKSGQVPPVYPGIYPNKPYENNARMTALATNIYVKCCGYKHTIAKKGTSKRAVVQALYGKSFLRVKREMRSLREYVQIQARMLAAGHDEMGAPFRAEDATITMLPAYSENETRVLFPSRSWPALKKNLAGETVHIELPSVISWGAYELARKMVSPYAKPLPGGMRKMVSPYAKARMPLPEEIEDVSDDDPGEDVIPRLSYLALGWHTVG